MEKEINLIEGENEITNLSKDNSIMLSIESKVKNYSEILEFSKNIEKYLVNKDILFERYWSKNGKKINIQSSSNNFSEKDIKDFLGLENEIEFLDSLNINSINIDNNKVYVLFKSENIFGFKPSQTYIIDINEFKKLWDILDESQRNELSQNIYRAVNVRDFGEEEIEINGEKEIKKILKRSLIIITNQDYDYYNNSIKEGKNFDELGTYYLKGLGEDRMEIAKKFELGHIAHEIGHASELYIWEQLKNNEDLMNYFKELLDEYHDITSYTAKHVDNIQVLISEFIAEIFRIYSTNKKYLPEEIMIFLQEVGIAD